MNSTFFVNESNGKSILGHMVQTNQLNDRKICMNCIIQNNTLVITRVTSVFSHTFEKGIPGLTHKWCVLQGLSYDTLNDVTVVLEMSQSIDIMLLQQLPILILTNCALKWKVHWRRRCHIKITLLYIHPTQLYICK